MPRSEMTGPEQTDRSIVDRLWGKRAELLWGLAAAVVLFSTVDTVLLVGLMLAIATVIAAWLGFRELLQRADRDDAAQPAAPLPQPASADRREPEATSTRTPWQGHHAA